MTDPFVEILVKLLIFLAEAGGPGNKVWAQLYLSPDLSGGDHPGHSWLVVLRLAVDDLVRLTVGDEDAS